MGVHWSWITSSWASVGMVALSAVGVYLALLLFTRLAGLRAFSKMSSFDFAITVAFGSIVGGTLIAEDPPLLHGVVGLGVLFLIQYVVSRVRRPPLALTGPIDNEPLLLMVGGEILHDNLEKGRMTEEDLRAKLREANVHRWDQIRAVVMETTGDVSVLHADPDAPPLERRLLQNVRGSDRHFPQS